MRSNTVCAVVVTYNRKELLRECLGNLKHQTRKINEIIVIDNASTDGTASLVKNEFPDVKLIELRENIGGAGGFYEGIKYAYENNFEWIWVLDDDTIPNLNALECLLKSYDRFPKQKKPYLLASTVLWKDGSLHPMNIPNIDTNYEKQLYATKQSCLSIRSNSFVSLLINWKVVDKYGLPHKEYFIWNDDIEYTSRILKNEFGIVDPLSIVTHKTKTKYTPIESTGSRYFYEVRNKLWLIRTNSLYKREKIKIFFSLLIGMYRYLKHNRYKYSSLIIILKGIIHGLFKYKKNKSKWA
ncbi:glycosyltransferase [Geobacillus kaustophilus HTA426]|uniref:Glycosyltransferase n=1 Tax=Geobacillus kaustophilus (strain HTA426) TaxID=235909 RepID=Q5KUN6_GEOKA|nr:glycosyltransferase family 2 protein [Geobacillus kaustophilus]BAD77600.1 glycosyltransferase [Geobacillus kaustophilus HTA426]